MGSPSGNLRKRNPVETPVEILISGQEDADPRVEIQEYKRFAPWFTGNAIVRKVQPGVAVLGMLGLPTATGKD